jgi:hypothetical protein
MLGLRCIFNATAGNSVCRRSTTLNQPCGWDSEGNDNCDHAFNEVCVCLGQTTPKCVDAYSTEYIDALTIAAGAFLPTPTPVLPSQEQDQINYRACTLSEYGEDIYRQFLSGEPFPAGFSPAIDRKVYGDCSADPNSCRKRTARLLCCSICTGNLLQKFEADYPGFSKIDNIFSDYIEVGYQKLVCGSDPDFVPALDACTEPFNWFSWNYFVENLQCATAPTPGYTLVTFQITVPQGTPEGVVSELVNGYLIANNINSVGGAVVVAVNDPFTFMAYVLFGSDADANAGQNSINSGFSGYISSHIGGASSAPTAAQTVEPTNSSASSVAFSMMFLFSILISLVFLFQ